jgi:hypothetical protein
LSHHEAFGERERGQSWIIVRLPGLEAGYEGLRPDKERTEADS